MILGLIPEPVKEDTGGNALLNQVSMLITTVTPPRTSSSSNNTSSNSNNTSSSSNNTSSSSNNTSSSSNNTSSSSNNTSSSNRTPTVSSTDREEELISWSIRETTGSHPVNPYRVEIVTSSSGVKTVIVTYTTTRSDIGDSYTEWATIIIGAGFASEYYNMGIDRISVIMKNQSGTILDRGDVGVAPVIDLYYGRIDLNELFTILRREIFG